MKSRHSIVLLLVLLFYVAETCRAAEPKSIDVEYISPESGLSHHQINAIFRDENGMLWIGTEDGLNRFDGHSVDIYRPDGTDMMPFSNTVTGLCGDRNGHIYLLSRHSISYYDMQSERFHSIRTGGVMAITCTDNGTMYYATAAVVFRYSVVDNTSTEYFSLGNDSAKAGKEVIQNICFDKAGNLFVGTTGGNVLKIENLSRITRYHIDAFYGFYPDNEGCVWTTSRTEGFMRILPDGTTVCYRVDDRTANALDMNNARGVAQVSPTEYFLGSYNGLELLDISTGERITYTYDLSLKGFNSRSVRVLSYDDGILFIGTFHAGLHYYIRNRDIYQTFGTLKHNQTNISAPIVSDMIKDRRGVLWIGTISGGINIVDPQNSINRNLKRALQSEKPLNVKAMFYEQERDILWVATFSEGIYRIDIENGSYRIVPPLYQRGENSANTAQNLMRFISIGNGEYLTCAVDGLLLFDEHTMRLKDITADFLPTLSSVNIYDIAVDHNRNLWICTPDFICRTLLDNPSSFNIYPAQSIASLDTDNLFLSAYCDTLGRMWFGSSGSGLFLFDAESNSFECFGAADGLTNCYINCITENTKGSALYLATNNGVAIFDPQSRHFDNFNTSNGYPMTIVSRLYMSSDSVLYACGLNGILATRESDLKYQQRDYHLFLKNIYVNNNRIVPGAENSIIALSPIYQHSLKFKEDRSTIMFEIVNSSLDKALVTAFEYRLYGCDDKYNTARSNLITYTNLKAGSYKLMLRGTIPNSKGEIPTLTFDIRVLPPFYRTWWFVLLVIAVVCTITFVLINNYFHNTRLKVQLSLEKIEKEQEKRINQSKTDFFNNVSHEFRTPLTLINSYLETLLKQHNLDPDTYKDILGAYNNTSRLRGMIDEFLDINRSEREQTISVTDNNISDFAKELYLMFNDYAKYLGIDFSFETAADSTVRFDRLRMSRVVSNLLSNSFKYTKSGSGRIVLSVSDTPEYAILSVIDNGVGIEPQNIDKVFDNFWREKRANQNLSAKGSGIGLSFAKSIVELHEGKLEVESQPGVRTVFTISLPHHSTLTPTMTPVVEAIESIEAEICKLDNKTILIIDDNAEMRDVLSQIFKPYYNVLTAADGNQGIETARHKQPDIVLSDVMMPGISGMEVCHTLKSDTITSHIPVVLLTALSADEQVIKGLSAGADDYITKPFHSQVLVARCNNILLARLKLQEQYAHDASKNVDELSSNSMDSKLLADAIAIIEKNISVPDFDIISFARELCMSRTQLFNKIKALTGMTPNNFVMSIKLKKAAAEIVACPGENISEIVYRCGFNTPSYFIKCFRRFYNETPINYRKRMLSGRTINI